MNPEDEKSIAELYQMRVDAYHKAAELEAEAARLREDVKWLRYDDLARKFGCTRHQVFGALMRQNVKPMASGQSKRKRRAWQED